MTKVTFKIKGRDERNELEQEWEFRNTDEIASFFSIAKDAQAAGWSFEIVKVERDGIEIGS